MPARDPTSLRDPDSHVIKDVATLKALADPIRLKFLFETAEEPRTVKEVASTLGVPPTRLYYHVRILERHGMVRVASRRMVSGIEERRYIATAKSWTVDSPQLNAAIASSGVLKTMFDMTAAEVEVALSADTRMVGDLEGAVPVLTFGRWKLSPDEVANVQTRLIELMESLDPQARVEGRTEYGTVLALYRFPGSDAK